MKEKKTAIAFAIICMLCSCNKEAHNPGSDIQGKAPLNLSVSTLTHQTRNLITGSSLASGSKIGLALTDRTGAEYDGLPYSNVCYTASGSSSAQTWNPDIDVMLSSSEAELYAYFPYSDKVTDISRIPVKASSDIQTDYMYAYPIKGLSNRNTDASITLQHALAAVRLSLSRGSYSGTGQVTSISVKGNGIATDAVMNGKDGTLSGITGTDTEICPDTEAFVLTAAAKDSDILLVPAKDRTTLTFTVTIDGHTYTLDRESVEIEQGKVTVFNAVVNNNSISISSISLDDWTYDSAGSPVIEGSWKVTITGDTDGISFANSIEDDGSVRIMAVPILEDAEVNPVSVYGDALVSESIDNDRGIRTILLSDIRSDIEVRFASYCLWVTATYNVTDTSSPTRLLSYSSYSENTSCLRMKVDGTEVPPKNSFKFSTAGEHVVQFVFNDKTKIPNSMIPQNDALIAIKIPEGITYIGNQALYSNINLKSIELPESLERSGYEVFSQCRGLSQIEFPDKYDMKGYGIMNFCTSLTSVKLPKNLECIDENAFYGCIALSGITLPESLTEIKANAFRNSGLTSIELPAGIKRVSAGVFRQCSKLSSVRFKGKIDSLDEEAFYDCKSLEEIIYEDGSSCRSSLSFPTSLNSIGTQAFAYCTGFTSVHISPTLTSIGPGAFGNANMVSVSVDASNPVYEKRGDFNAIVHKESNTLIFGCPDAKVVPESISIIGPQAYYQIPIKRIDLHSGITEIGENAFYYTKKLTEIICRSVVPPALNGFMTFYQVGARGKLKVPAESVETYKNSLWMSMDSYYLGCNYWSVAALSEGE